MKRQWAAVATLAVLTAATLLRAAEPAGLPAVATPPPSPPTMSPAAKAGAEPFAANCGFCHGRDATGGSTGPDLTHSDLVAADNNGNLISDLLRTGRPDKGMPAITTISAKDLAAIVAFVHYEKTVSDSAFGQRRSVDASDLTVGNADSGKRYFDKQCSSCHSATGDLAGISKRVSGLNLLRRVLYPGSESRTGTRSKPATVEVTTKDGKHYNGDLQYRDEFVIALRETNGTYHSWSTKLVTFSVNDPLEAHVQQLARYTDADLHDVYAYLQGLQ
ncbi:MAG TPA: cytochrome c [Candidatus Acidoferrum sp.]|nr:cytochrome c [Candidatus Acidoferrum sp.]